MGVEIDGPEGSDRRLLAIGATDWYRQVNETTSYAGFGQVDWRLADGWELILGGRYSYDRKEIDNDAIAGDFVVINQTFSNSVSENWSALFQECDAQHPVREAQDSGS